MSKIKKLKTYTDSKFKDPFDWNKFLTKPIRTDKQWDDAEELSVSWVTCACGTQCEIIPRWERDISLLDGSRMLEGMPKDKELKTLGVAFHRAICATDEEDALYFLRKIEKRSAVLIAKIQKSKLKTKQSND